MIIYRIFFGVLWSPSVFFLYLFMVPKRVLLSTLATPPVSFVQTRPPVLLQVFLHSGKLLSISVCTEVVCPYFTFTPPLYKLGFRTLTSSSQSCSVLFIWYVISHFPSLRFVSDLPEIFLQCFCVLSSAHTLQRRLSVYSRRISLSVRSFPPHCELGGASCCRSAENLTGRRRDESCSTLGSFSRHISDVGSLPWKPDWYKAQI